MRNVAARIRLSAIAVVAAWLIFVLLIAAMAVLRALFDAHAWANSQNPFFPVLLVGIGSFLVVAVIWFLVVLPLAVFVPDGVVFWKPEVLALIGAIAGPLIVCLGAIYEIRSNPTIRIYNVSAYIMGGVIFPGIPSAIIGGITGAIAGRLHAKLKSKKS